jgi:hypothetical protein
MAKVSGWPGGVDNRSKEQSLARDERGHTIALREAENVDLDKDGKIQRRQGATKVTSGIRVHSLWGDAGFPLALYVDNGELMALQTDLGSFSVRDGLDPGQPVSFALAAGRAYWTNRMQTGSVTADGVPMPWGVDAPHGQPGAAGGAGIGGLDAGTYQVAVTFVSAAGEESGASRAASVQVPQGGGITLTDIPQPVDASQMVRVYRTGANGGGSAERALLYHATDLPAGTTTVILGAARLGRPLATQFLEVMPPGQIVRQHAGRLWVAATATIVYSESLRYGLTKLPQNRIAMPHVIDLMEPVGNGDDGAAGLFVASGDRTYWLGGSNPADMRAAARYPEGGGAVPGTAVRVAGTTFGLETSEPVAYWLARNGVGCVGLPGGNVLPLKPGQAVAPSAEQGASAFRDERGMRQVITTLQAAAPRGVAMGDQLDCEIIRHDA